jgi:isopentenyl-diphosphate delta-isomerase
MLTQTQSRKSEHVELCAHGEVGFRTQSTMFEELHFGHDAVPELSLNDIDCTTPLFGKTLRAPLVISSMTGGNEHVHALNQHLATIAEAAGVAIGVGSQRAMLETPDLARFYAMRSAAPTALLFANIGGVTAAHSETRALQSLVDAIDADALCVHLNPAMELVQPEGDRDFRGIVAAIERLVGELSVPVIVKETGCGLGARATQKLRAVGCQHVEVSGAGGTSWVGVETLRAEQAGVREQSLGALLWDWGVPTALSTAICVQAGFATVIASGGIANGLDGAKAIALGASAFGIARPVLQALARDPDSARAFVDDVVAQLRAVMLLVGAPNIEALRAAPLQATDAFAARLPASE